MIAGDRKALKATLNHGITNILRQLVDLYSFNLNQLSIQTAVLAGLAFNGAIQPNFFLEVDGFGPRATIYAWVFSTLIQIAMITSFLSMVVSTLASQYGPSLALTGNSSKIVVYAVRSMQEMQEYSFWLSALSIIFLFASLTAYGFYAYRIGNAIVILVMSVIGSVVIFRRGVVTLQDIRFKGTKYLDDILRAMDGGEVRDHEVRPPSTSYQGYVWKRKELHKGGHFVQLYAVLHKGTLQFFKSKEVFDDGDERLFTIHLKYHRVSTKRQDLQDAASQFGVFPLEDHEVLNSSDAAVLQALTREDHKEWVAALKEVERYFRKVRGNALTAVLENVNH